MRFAPFAQALILTACLAPAARADAPSTAEQTVAVMNKLWGAHPGMRANHAKGIVVEGSFTPSPGAAKLSKAVIFTGPAVPVTVRFSDSTGLPSLADGAPNANPHGMAVKFHTADGSEVDVVTNSLKFFPVATGEDFRDLLTANSQSPPGTPKPTPVEKFIATHPAVPKAFGSVSTPVSFANETYNGVDAFVFVSKAGKRQPFRFQIVPIAGTKHMTPQEAAKQKPDFLMAELPARLATQKVQFKLMAQLANPRDQTKDPTQPWPADRKMVQMGTITLTAADPDSVAAEKKLLYLPNNLTDGIEVSDDPLIDARDQAYAVSYGKRTQ
jgi:catalase